jgi:phytol kinase
MPSDLIYILIFSVAFLMIFIINEIIYKFFKINAEYTRKSAHILSGLLTMLLPQIFTSHFPVLILSIEFLLLLIISIKFDFFKCINNVERKTWGSFLFPVSVYICFYISIHYNDKALFYIPILIMSLSDPLAAISGKIYYKINKMENTEKKTYTGSLFFIFSALIISLILLNSFYNLTFFWIIVLSLIISISTTFIERISKKGLDNITIPFTVILILILFKSL